MAATSDGIQDPYLAILNIYTYEYLKLYKKEIIGLPESDRYYLTRSNWTEFYQELEDAVSTFGFKSAVFIVAAIDALRVPTDVKDIILY